MGFGLERLLNFGSNKDSADQDKDKKNAGGNFISIPENPSDGLGDDEYAKEDINQQKKELEKGIQEEENSSNPDMGRLEHLRKKLDILNETQ